MSNLSIEELRVKLDELPGWKIEGSALKKVFEFPTFADAMIFVNEFAQTADDFGHYPFSVEIRGPQIIISLVSSDGFLSDKDLLLAEQAQKIESGIFDSQLEIGRTTYE